MSKNQVALFEDQLAALANESVKAEQASSQMTFLSTKGGQLTYRNDPVAGNKLACIILTAPVERLYYKDRYDASKIVPPNCVAIDASSIGMKPLATSTDIQHATCEGCPKNEWGSSPTGGKGKACRETRRILIIPADAVTSAASVASAEVAAIRPPVTSLKNYSSYVQTVATAMRRPPLAVITEISVVPDAKTQFKVVFNTLKAIDDPAVIEALIARSKIELEKAITSANEGMAEEDGTPTAQSDRF